MKHRWIIFTFVIAQVVLVLIELFTQYDTSQRQLALTVTNIVTTAALLLFNRWLSKRGSALSAATFVFVAAAVWLDALGNFQHLYAEFWWWDRLTHTVGGMALSAVFIDLFLSLRKTGQLQAGWSWAAWMGVLVGQMVGSLYEISEWLGDLWFKTERVRGPYDTPHDLFQNLIGGLLLLAILRFFRHRQ